MKPITKPTLLLNEHIVRRNIERMAQKASDHNLEFKPHFKTHQSLKIGAWFRDYGVDKITVSSVKMAEYFANAGWNDITIAFPFNPLVSDQINQLARNISLSILVSDRNSFNHLRNKITEPINIYVEIDTGSDRTGFKPAQTDLINQLAKQIAEQENLNFTGFYSHPGHSYSCQSEQEIQSVHQDVVKKMSGLKNHFSNDFSKLKTCIGDTPCCSVGQHFEGIDQISPGNFVFYDLMQTHIGSCKPEDIAVALACPVVATYPKRNEIIVHGGAVHLSKESQMHGEKIYFGQCTPINDNLEWGKPIADCYVTSVSQEHGIIKGPAKLIDTIRIGDVIGILPVHSCLTADTMQSYISINSGEQIDHLQGL